MSKKENWVFSQAYYNKQKTVKEFAESSHADLVFQIHELRFQLNGLQQTIDKQEQERSHLLNKKNAFSDYKQEWSYPTKILFIISEIDKPLSSIEVQKHLMQLDYHFKSLQRLQTTLSSILSRSCKTGRIAKYKVKGKKDLLFVLPHWLDKSGELKEHYLKKVCLY